MFSVVVVQLLCRVLLLCSCYVDSCCCAVLQDLSLRVREGEADQGDRGQRRNQRQRQGEQRLN